jgi:hypothetical protein
VVHAVTVNRALVLSHGGITVKSDVKEVLSRPNARNQVIISPSGMEEMPLPNIRLGYVLPFDVLAAAEYNKPIGAVSILFPRRSKCFP